MSTEQPGAAEQPQQPTTDVELSWAEYKNRLRDAYHQKLKEYETMETVELIEEITQKQQQLNDALRVLFGQSLQFDNTQALLAVLDERASHGEGVRQEIEASRERLQVIAETIGSLHNEELRLKDHLAVLVRELQKRDIPQA